MHPHKQDVSQKLSAQDQAVQSKEICLQRGDVLQLLPTVPPGTIDAVITDPPYCSGGMSAAERARDPVSKYCQNNNSDGRPSFGGDARDQRSFIYWCTLWLTLARQAAKESAYCVIFIDWRNLPAMTDAMQAAGWCWRGVAVWNKGRGSRAPHKGYFRHQCEYLVWGTNGPVPRPNDRGPFDGCFDVAVKRADKHHITGKPTELMRRLVQIVPAGGLVLDPFAGSGTTGVAAVLEGRQFLGFEASAEYAVIAKERIAAAQSGQLLQRKPCY